VPQTRKPNPTPPTPPSKPRPLPPTPNASRPSSSPAQTSPLDAASLHGQPFVNKPAGTAAGIDKLARRLLAGMLLAALPPDTIPALLRTISTLQHLPPQPTCTLQHNLGYESAHPTLADILAATDTITRCATEADQCTSVELAAAYVRKATKRPDPANCKASPPVPLRMLLR